jgi:hypothetical protein
MNIPRISLNRISSWANVFSWVVLVVQVIYFVGGIFIEIQSGGFALRTDLFSMLFALSPLVSGAALFIILQAISVGASILLDIDMKR